MPVPTPGVWGIDVGLCALKAIRLENVNDQVTATAFDYVEHSKILSQPDADPDALTREALEKFLSRNTLKGDQVAICVPGQSGLARFVKLPPVEEKKIVDIVRFEAKQQIPFPLEEVVWDYQKISSGQVTDGFALETEIGLFAMKRDMINRALQPFKDVGIEVHVVQMAPLALCNFLAYDVLKKGNGAPAEAAEEAESADEDGKKCMVALDIGTDSSNLVVCDGDKIIWQRPIPLGGNHFTRALTKELKLTFAKAEHLKRNAAKSPDLKKILSALKPVLNDFVGEAQRSLGYFTNTHRDANITTMLGLGNAFRLPGLQKFLAEKLSLDVQRLSKFERMAGDSVITAPTFTQNILSFAVAYGGALQGLRLSKVTTNLLPPEIQLDRMIRAKKPWAVAAAAALLLGLPALTIAYTLEKRGFAHDDVVAAMGAGKQTVDKAKQYSDKYDAKLKAVLDNERAVKTIVSGQEERLNWIVLNRFINDCLPVPAVRVEGTYQGLTAKKDAALIIDREGKERVIPLANPSKKQGTIGAIWLGTGNRVPLEDLAGKSAELKKGDEVTILYQPDPGTAKYWTSAALDAYGAQLVQQASAGTSGDSKTDDKSVENLIQVSIESMYARYGNLEGYFKNLGKATNGNFDGMPQSDRNAPPTDNGWVVELRGYTYHDRNRLFVVETLIENLIQKSRPAAAAGKADAGAAAGSTKPGEVAKPGDKPKPQDAAKSDGKPKPADTKPTGPAEKTVPAKAGAAAAAKPGPAAKPDATAPASKEDLAALLPVVIYGDKDKPLVSHPCLLKYETFKNPEPGRFHFIGESSLGLVPEVSGGGGGGEGSNRPGGGAGGVGGGAALPGGGMGGEGRGHGGSSWKSLLGGGGKGGGEGAKLGGGVGGGIDQGMGGGLPNQPQKAPKDDKNKSAKSTEPARTEFVVLFIWKEPLPSEAKAAPAKSTSQGGGGGQTPKGGGGATPQGGGAAPQGGGGQGGSDAEKSKPSIRNLNID